MGGLLIFIISFSYARELKKDETIAENTSWESINNYLLSAMKYVNDHRNFQDLLGELKQVHNSKLKNITDQFHIAMILGAMLTMLNVFFSIYKLIETF
jgi:hypothetical protein